MSFNIEIAVEGAVSQIQQHETALDSVASTAAKTREALTQTAAAGQSVGTQTQAGAAAAQTAMKGIANAAALAQAGVLSLEESTRRLEDARGKFQTGSINAVTWQRTQQIHQTYTHLREGDTESASALWGDSDTGALAKRMREIISDVGKLTGGGDAGGGGEEDRAAKLLERIKAPMRDYKADVEALSQLLAAGKIVQAEYDSELERLTSRVGAMHGPVQQLTAEMQLQAQILQRLKAPAESLHSSLDALDALYSQGKISLGEYEAETAKVIEKSGQLQAPMQQVSEELKRQQQVLQSIKGPLQEYEKNMTALEALHAKGAISDTEFKTKADEIQKKAGVWQGPIQQQPKAEETAGISIGDAFKGAALGGALLQLKDRLEGVIQQMHDLEDVSIRAANAAQKFRDSQHSVMQIEDEQLALASQLHANYTTTIALYDKVREGSEGIALSHAEQLRLTQTLGEAVQLANKPIESSAQILTNLSTAMATGSITTADLKNTMRDVPAIANLWTSSFHTTREGLLDMVKVGKVNIYDLVDSMLKGGQQIDDKFKFIKKTNEETEKEYIERDKLMSERYGVGAGFGHAAEQLATVGIGGGGIDWGKLPGQGRDLSDVLATVYGKLENVRAAAERVNQANMAGVQNELDKLNDPIDKAKLELDALNKAFGMGKVDVAAYEQELSKLLTTINRGRQPEALRINLPIMQAKESLKDLQNALDNGDVNQAQFEKRRNELLTTINGVLPETEKLTQPIHDAKRAMEDLRTSFKAGKIDGEQFRKEYNSLITTINDGRLPDAIKYWESFSNVFKEYTLQLGGLNAVYAGGAMARLFGGPKDDSIAAFHRYNAELSKLAATLIDLGDKDLEAAERHALNAGMAGPRTIGGVGVALGTDRGESDADRAQSRADHQSFEDQHRNVVSDAAAAQRASSLDGAPQFEGYGSVEEQYADTKIIEQATEAYKQFAEPLQTYNDAIAGISRAQHERILTDQQALALTQRATDAYRQQVDALDPVAKLLHDLEAPMRAYNEQIRVLNDARPQLTARQYADALDKVRLAYLQSSEDGKSFLGGLEQGWIRMKQQAESFDATVAGALLSDVDKLNDAIITTANGGAASWRQMVDSMIDDLGRLLLKQLEVKAVNGLIGLISGDASGVVGDAPLPGIGQTLADQYPHSDGSGPITSPSAVASAPPLFGPSAVVAPSTPPEYPSSALTSAATQRSAGSRTSGEGSQTDSSSPVQVTLQNHNIYDDSIVHAALQTRAGQQILLNFMKSNKNALR